MRLTKRYGMGRYFVHLRTPFVVLEGNLTARRYILVVLEEHVVPFFEQHTGLRIFQYNALCRTHIELPPCLKCIGVAMASFLARPMSQRVSLEPAWAKDLRKGISTPDEAGFG